MKKLIMGLVVGAALATGGAASADCLSCGKYDVKLTVNGNPFYGNWAIVKDRPFVGIEAFSDYVGVPRSHYYKGWSFAKTPAETIEPLDHLVTTEGKKVETIRFGFVARVSSPAACRIVRGQPTSWLRAGASPKLRAAAMAMVAMRSLARGIVTGSGPECPVEPAGGHRRRPRHHAVRSPRCASA